MGRLGPVRHDDLEADGTPLPGREPLPGLQPDSRTAIYDNAGALIMVDVQTGRELARFEGPEQTGIDQLKFTPRGAHLVTTIGEQPYLHVWDLGAIRCWLATLGLDWDAPTIADAGEAPDPFTPFPKPVRLESGLLDSWQALERTSRVLKANPDDPKAHHERAHALVRLNRFDEALAAFTAALKAQPEDPHLLAHRGFVALSLERIDEALVDCEAALRRGPLAGDEEQLARVCNDVAWILTTRSGHPLDPARALNLARQAVRLTPGRAIYLNTLGVVQYRAGQFAETIATLEKSLEADQGATDAFDLFFLAMSRARLGEVARAAPTSISPCNGGASTRTSLPSGPQTSTPSRPRPAPCWTAPCPNFPPTSSRRHLRVDAAQVVRATCSGKSRRWIFQDCRVPERCLRHTVKTTHRITLRSINVCLSFFVSLRHALT